MTRLHVHLASDGWCGELRRDDGSLRFLIGGCASRDEALAYMQANAGEPFEVIDDDAAAGMAWWNRLDESERRHWLDVAGTAVVADAWAAWKRSDA